MTLRGKKTLFVKRQVWRDRTFAIFNFEKEPIEIRPFVEEGHWEKFLDSASEEWDGMGSSLLDEILVGWFRSFSIASNLIISFSTGN